MNAPAHAASPPDGTSNGRRNHQTATAADNY